MSHLKLKQITGPSNGKQGGLIVFDGTSPKWSTDITAAMQVPSGSTAQRPATPAAGLLRYNTDIGGVEVSNGTTWNRLDPDLSVMMQRFSFRMAYTSEMKVGDITELPAGWTYTKTDTSFRIYTGLGKAPGGGAIYGQEDPTGTRVPATQYQYRSFNTSVEINYDTATPDYFSVIGITSKVLIGTEAGGHAYFHIYF